MTRAEILAALRSYKQDTSSRYGIQALGLFGSMARDDSKPSSDIDIVVQLEKQDLFCLIGIKQELQELLHAAIDLVSYRPTMNEFLKNRVERDAIYV